MGRCVREKGGGRGRCVRGKERERGIMCMGEGGRCMQGGWRKKERVHKTKKDDFILS